MPIISTGQITIVDNNDARPLTAYITANPGSQQIYTKDESTTSFSPDWTTANSNVGMELRARVFAGGTSAATDVTGALTNRKFTLTQGGTAFITGNIDGTTNAFAASSFEAGGSCTLTLDSTQAKLNLKANLKVGGPPVTIFFEGDYTDPITALTSHIIATITLSQVKTGTNAVFLNIRSPDGNILEPDAPVNATTTVRVFADLIRAAGVDDTGVNYRWFKHPFTDQIDFNHTNIADYGFINTANSGANGGTTGPAPHAGSRGNYVGGTAASPTVAAISSTNMPDGQFSDAKGMLVHHNAVVDLAIYKVEARDTDNIIYQQFFTIYDVSDPFEVKLISTAGEKLQNGVGNTDVYPILYYGSDKVTSGTGLSYEWTFYDKNGARGAFVDATRTAVAGGRNIGTHTNTSLSYDGAAITWVDGDIVKASKGSLVEYFEVSGTTHATGTVNLRAPTVNTWLPNNYATLTADKFKGGKLFVCLAKRNTSGLETAAKIALSGDDIDAKGVIFVEVTKA